MTPQTVTSDWRLASPVPEHAYMLSPPPTFCNRSDRTTSGLGPRAHPAQWCLSGSHVVARSTAPSWPTVWYSGMASSIRWFTALM